MMGFGLLLQSTPLYAQLQPSRLEQQYFKLVRDRFEEQRAFETVAFVEQRWRLAGNSGFNESIYQVEKVLQSAGFVKEDEGGAGSAVKAASGAVALAKAGLSYRIERRPMKRPTWEPIDAECRIVGDTAPLLTFRTNRNMVAMYSASTPPEGITAEVIDVGTTPKSAWQGRDLRGKILMADGGIGGVYANAVEAGAIGALGYSIPAYNQPEKYQHSIQFLGIPYRDADHKGWGICLSYAARQRLKAALAKGPVQLQVSIKTKIYASEELTVVAEVKGSVKPDERFVYSAHVQEPGANDNATGVGTLAEMARVTGMLYKAGQFVPKRTLTFLWGDEIVSTRRYIEDDSVRARGIKWGLSLDMVGEDTEKTGGTFLIEKMPDPSAIWTRGDDKHSEWGGSPLRETDMFPHYFNDLLLNRCLNEAKGNGWVVKTNPFEGGSDHTPFLQAKIPGLLMWHFTDAFYHTDADRLDKVSATTMRHVGVSALVTAYLLTTADSKTAVALIGDITHNALERLSTERRIGMATLAKTHDAKQENQIIAVWQHWYAQALEATADIAVEGADAKVRKAIAKAIQQVRDPKFKILF